MKPKIVPFVFLLIVVWLANGCRAAPQPAPAATATLLDLATAILLPTATSTAAPELIPSATEVDPSPTPEPSPTTGPTPTLSPEAWREMPVIPTTLSARVYEIYEMGKEMGNNPNAFSKVGDCNSTRPYFLVDFDNPEAYKLGEYAFLQPTIDYFAGSFGRKSMAVKQSLTATAVMATLWNDWQECSANETPLACEYRIHKPAFAIISFGTNDAMGIVPFEGSLRKVIEFTIAQGIVPILGTKADNAEGDWHLNEIIARLAYEYELPLWNYWLAVQSLPEQGMRSPEHLTYSGTAGLADFEADDNLDYGWPVRNLTALQALDFARQQILEYEASK